MKNQSLSFASAFVMAALAWPFCAIPLRAAVNVTAANVKPALPVIPKHNFLLTDFGAVGDGKTLNTEAFAKAIAAVNQAGGGKLVIPKGIFITRPFKLCSNLDLHLDRDAVIKAPETFAGWGLPEPTTFRTQEELEKAVKPPTPMITGENLHDVSLTGDGTIDGSGAIWWTWSEKAAARAAPAVRVFYHRPNLIMLTGVERLYVSDLTFTNSSRFHFVPRNVTDLTVERVKVRAPADSPNTDALDPGPVTNCLIRDCDISVGDDDIVIKSGGTNVLIENCTIHQGHGISIGSGTTVGIHNMLVRNCTFEGTKHGLRIKSMRGAGGKVDNVRYTNIQMKDVGDAIMLYLDYVDSNRPNFVGEAGLTPSIHNILFDHITVANAERAGVVNGLPESRITDVTFQDVKITAKQGFTTKDADKPKYENVAINVQP